MQYAWIGFLLIASMLALANAAAHDASKPGEHGRKTGRTGFTVDPGEYTAQFWYEKAQKDLEHRLKIEPNLNVAKNLVMFLGDGMSVPTLFAARTLLGQRQGQTGEEASLNFEDFPTVGLAKTYCVSDQIADSACTATAYLCGIKNNRGTLGITAKIPRYDCEGQSDTTQHVQSIAEWALAAGKDVGIVTTTSITHASPGGAYAKVANRNWESDMSITSEEDGDPSNDPSKCDDIAKQLIRSKHGKQFKVLLGGGRREFRPNTTLDEEGQPGGRGDGADLIQEWIDDKNASDLSHAYVWNRETLLAHRDNPPDYLFGLFKPSHMDYHMQANATTQPTFEEMVEIAIRTLSRNPNGFFLFAEGGRIDQAHHRNLVHMALDETIEFSKGIEKGREMLSTENTLMVVTADHSHVMQINGYSARGNDILGPSTELDKHGVPYMTLTYSNGPGFRNHSSPGIRADVTHEDNYRDDTQWQTHVEVELDSETHAGDDVAVFALGPHHHLFTGLYEQHNIPHMMAYAACIGPGLTAPACNFAASPSVAFVLLIIAAFRCLFW